MDADWILPPPPPPAARVVGRDARFPVRRIWCVGRNYAEHAREMGADPVREAPFFFAKPADALVADGGPLPYPPCTADLHHEVELVVALHGGGRDLEPAEVPALIFGYGIGIDWTRRDLQATAKAQGRPWDAAKGFDRSATLGPLHPAAAVGHPASGRIWLAVEGVTRQEGDLSDLIWSVPEALAALSRLFELRPGDLLYTGTPAGVGPVRPGETVTAGIAGLGELSQQVVEPLRRSG